MCLPFQSIGEASIGAILLFFTKSFFPDYAKTYHILIEGIISSTRPLQLAANNNYSTNFTPDLSKDNNQRRYNCKATRVCKQTSPRLNHRLSPSKIDISNWIPLVNAPFTLDAWKEVASEWWNSINPKKISLLESTTMGVHCATTPPPQHSFQFTRSCPPVVAYFDKRNSIRGNSGGRIWLKHQAFFTRFFIIPVCPSRFSTIWPSLTPIKRRPWVHDYLRCRYHHRHPLAFLCSNKC
jgi:hypothetical protein